MAKNTYRVENVEYEADDLDEGSATIDAHRKRIEPWLSAIFQAEHLNLLVGSGFSMGLANLAGAKSASMERAVISATYNEQVNEHADIAAKKMGRGKGNIEDQFRSAFALLAGLEVLDPSSVGALEKEINNSLSKLANEIIEMESSIVGCEDPIRRLQVQRVLGSFLLSFSSRNATRDRLHVFTTNYDRLIEYGFDLIGARSIDRFVGALEPRFRASRFDVDIHYSQPGNRFEARPLEGVVRFSKLHGSLDWWAENNEIVRRFIPVGGRGNMSPEDSRNLMVFPNAAKDIETAFYPYAEMVRDFSAAICRPNAALVTYGYGFGDDHLNRILRDMLSLPSTHLVIISFNDADGRIPEFIERCGRISQITKLIGPDLAGLTNLVDFFLPKPSIDLIFERQTKLLEGRKKIEPEQVTGGTE
ncbi:SIR2 family protein [Thalassospira alkalitolerans]|uniref:SIR2 family protein n=1 Tax=Thalassospira alkalitolerans TaxID=1293890 RepID=UPI000A1E182A|nr:SIR2 family protein [Thalassospira alkalitolerans]